MPGDAVPNLGKGLPVPMVYCRPSKWGNTHPYILYLGLRGVYLRCLLLTLR